MPWQALREDAPLKLAVAGPETSLSARRRRCCTAIFVGSGSIFGGRLAEKRSTPNSASTARSVSDSGNALGNPLLNPYCGLLAVRAATPPPGASSACRDVRELWLIFADRFWRCAISKPGCGVGDAGLRRAVPCNRSDRCGRVPGTELIRRTIGWARRRSDSIADADMPDRQRHALGLGAS